MAPNLRARSPLPLYRSNPATCRAALAWRRASPREPPIKPRPMIATRLNMGSLPLWLLEIWKFFQPGFAAVSESDAQQVSDFVAQPYDAFLAVEFYEAWQHGGI